MVVNSHIWLEDIYSVILFFKMYGYPDSSLYWSPFLFSPNTETPKRASGYQGCPAIESRKGVTITGLVWIPRPHVF